MVAFSMRRGYYPPLGVVLRFGARDMKLSRAACPLCTRPIVIVVERADATIRCPGCGRSLLLTPTGLRAASAPSTEPPRPVRPAARTPARAAHPHTAPQSVAPPLPTKRLFERRDTWLLGAGVGGAVLLVMIMAVVLAVMSAGPTRSHNGGHEGEETAFVLHDSQQGEVAVGAKRRPPKPAATASVRDSDRRRSVAAPRPRLDAAATRHGHSDDPVKDALGSVAVVTSPDGHGSGFMAAPDCLVTNRHVIAMARMADVRVGFPDNAGVRGQRFPAQLIVEDPVNDIAVLRVECGVNPLPIDESYQHVNGQKVVAIGSPGTGSPGGEMLENLTTDGRLGPACTMPNGGARWSMAMAINPGNSGGPIIDAIEGHVIGVAVAKFIQTDSQALAVPHPVLMSALQSAQRATSADQRRTEGLHRARFCLEHMVRVLQLSALSMDESCQAAKATTLKTDEGMLEAFNDCKSRATRALSDELASFETLIGAEVSILEKDNGCEVGVRAGVVRLRSAIEEQITNLRKSVALDEINDFLRDYRTAQDRARSLSVAVAKSLAVDIDEETEE